MTLLPWLWKTISCLCLLFVCNKMYFKHLASQLVLMILARWLSSQVLGELETCYALICLTFLTLFSTCIHVLQDWGHKGSTILDPAPQDLYIQLLFCWGLWFHAGTRFATFHFVWQVQELDLLLRELVCLWTGLSLESNETHTSIHTKWQVLSLG